MTARLAREWAVFLLALQFMTRLPVRAPDWSAALMAETPRWYAAVGILVGLLTGAVFWAAALVFPPALAALLSTAAGLFATGCFHEDGFADCCDGLGGGATRERALEIMRDSRLGTYGAAGLGLMLAAKILALASFSPGLVPLILVAGHSLSRASCVLVMATSFYVRDKGAGSPVATGPGSGGLAVTLATAVLAIGPLALVVGPSPAAAGLVGLALGHLAIRRRFEARLGGYTGDCLGAVQQCGEIGFLLGLLAWL